ncbi:MAG: hypothetical protein ACJ72N_07285 [Labedaea sp.]
MTYDTAESAAAAGEAAQPAIVEDVGPGDVPADEESTPTYVQLTDPAEIAGKTVERVETCVWNKLFLVFTDGTFLAVGIEYDEYEHDNASFRFDDMAEFFERVLLGLSPDGEGGYKKVYIARIRKDSGAIESKVWAKEDPHPSDPVIDDLYASIEVTSLISAEHARSEAIRVRQEWLPQQEAEERQRQEARAAKERAEYERLKAKFGETV